MKNRWSSSLLRSRNKYGFKPKAGIMEKWRSVPIQKVAGSFQVRNFDNRLHKMIPIWMMLQ